VPGVSTDWTVTSFDGTLLRAHWFPLAAYRPGTTGATHPTVLMGPGWGEAGDTDAGSGAAPGGPGILSALPISDLLDAGYNVLTWDPRGFGSSGGTIEVDSPSYEARDVSALISWVATRPGVELDAPGDPRMGMVGASYGGGIQLVTAATDCRVDAIVPIVAWHSLVTSLDKAGIVKTGWAGILERAAATHHPSAEEVAADADGASTGGRPGWSTGSPRPP
jgi:ABC-2 type transport system ATP-binding protein